jgi:hypothetical protein
MKRSKACLLFRIQLQKLKRERGIVTAFWAYLGFLVEFCKNKKYIEWTDWQVKDMIMCIYNVKINPTIEVLENALNYTRRGGKTRTLTILAVFFTLIGLRVVWRAPHSDQLIQAAEWFDMNPFVESQKIRTQFRVQIFGSPELSVAVLSEGRIASREADVLIYDEGGSIMSWHQNFDYYKNSRPMIAASKNKYIIHASTDCQGSVFYEEFRALQEKEHEYSTRFTSTHPWKDTTWITKEWIEQEQRAHLDCSWYIDQNYNCIAVVRGGRIFRNLIEVGSHLFPNYPIGFLDDYIPTNAGVDFNGENVGHYLVLITYDNDYVYVIDEINFWDLLELFDYEGLTLELEDGLFNTAFTDQTKRMGLSCIYQEWKEDIKHLRLQECVNRKIVINKHKTPITYKNLLEAGWDENHPRPKLKKRPDQHGLDALLHALNGVYGNVDVVARKIKKNLFGRLEMTNPLRGI